MLPVVLLIGFCTLVIKHGATDVTAYRHGKEAPSIEKFRKRHDKKGRTERGESKLASPSKRGGKEPGPMRKWFRAVRDNAADELIEKHNHKSEARRKWYRRTAPDRETQWQTKWQDKLDKRERKIRQWGQSKGVIDPSPAVAERAESESSAERSAEAPAQPQQPQPGEPQQPQPTKTDEPLKIQFPKVEDFPARPAQNEKPEKTEPAKAEKPAEPTFGTGGDSTPAPATTTGGTVYEQGVQELADSAEEIRQFCTDMDQFADGLSGRRYGNEITGLAGEMSNTLSEAGDIYADLGEEIQTQGDDVRDAHESTDHQIPDEAAMA